MVGSGPGGSAVADVLTAAGWSVVIFEKGRNHLIDLDEPSRRKTDYSNDEIKLSRRRNRQCGAPSARIGPPNRTA